MISGQVHSAQQRLLVCSAARARDIFHGGSAFAGPGAICKASLEACWHG